MISQKIKEAVEKSILVSHRPDLQRYGEDWRGFTRTAFDNIARWINIEVTKKVIDSSFLVRELLLFGEDELENILFKNGLPGPEDFITHLKGLSPQRPHHWISGKTLQLYWNNGNAKDKKLNVLLTFLGVDLRDWDEWKRPHPTTPLKNNPLAKFRQGSTFNLLKKYYLGSYYRYYQKTDNSPVMIKTPLIIREDAKQGVVVETKTIGHRYQSSSIVIRDGALYIECENLDWNEKESYIFNIGFATNPQVLIGVSITMSKRRLGLSIKNVLVRQPEPFDYGKTCGVEIPFDTEFPHLGEEATTLEFFKRNSDNLIVTHYCHNLDELATLSQGRLMID